MSKEIPQPAAYDVDMFSGQLRDTRTKKQKDEDFARQFKQPFMFSQADIAQFGVSSRPLMPISDKTRLGLEMFDARTEEEKERDLQRAAQRLTIPLFAPEPAPPAILLLPAQCATTIATQQREAEQQTAQALDTPSQEIGESEPDEERLIFDSAQAMRLGFPVL
jgi:hypothetical protein